MARPSVLVIHNRYLEPGGEDEVVRSEVALLRRQGHRVLQYVRDNRDIADFSRLRRASLVVTTTWDRDSYNEICALIQQEKPEVAHCHNLFPLLSPSVYYACAAEGIPVVQTVHNYRLLCPGGNFFRNGSICDDCRGNLARSMVRGCYHGSRGQTTSLTLMLGIHRALGTWVDKVTTYIAPSEFCRSKLIEGGISARKIAVKPHFVSEMSAPKSAFGDYAVFVGRLSEEKGILPLLEMWRGLKEIPLVIVGSGPLEKAARRRADDIPGCTIRFTGHLPREQALSWIHAARFLVAPSRCYETFGLAVLEAMACGVPAIVPRHGALRELVCNRRTGLIVDLEDPEAWPGVIHWAWSHPLETWEMGRAAHSHCLDHYSVDANYQQLMDLYRSACVADEASDSQPSAADLVSAAPCANQTVPCEPQAYADD